MREPLYPLLLAATGALTSSGPATATLIVHFLIGRVALLSVARLWKGLGQRIAAIVGCGVMFSRCHWTHAVMVEWCAVALIAVATSLAGRAAQRQNSLYPFAVAAGMFSLLHPALNALLIPAAGVVLGAGYRRGAGGIVGPIIVTIGFLLDVASFKFYRTSQFSPAPFGNIQRLGIAATIGGAPIEATDEPEMQKFFLAVNERRTAIDFDLTPPEALHRGTRELLHVSIVNTWEVHYGTMRSLSLSIARFDEYAGIFFQACGERSPSNVWTIRSIRTTRDRTFAY